ncbi:hypothetical protein [Sporosarcina sp. G11-34]|uniref:hypothetical protein n=1 Tax=Sporosarcina sp. G11-34 TaxID=2849605 RepID=UPI0022A97F46|nr:hypothetical protein [Sporosarcina sp. G11-34]MCZ2257848.1 hypothetical protein [Sporosarcina sp. G11-34]
MVSKYIDIALIIFMGYFAYTRFTNEQYGFAAMFAALCLLNIVTAIVKHNKLKENAQKK